MVMKAIRIYAQLALLMLVGGMTMQAQNISGKVVDETNQSVPYANVVQLSQDSTFLGGCVTDENGAFQMAKVQNAALLKVSFIGYKDKWLPLSGTQTNLGTIQLELDAVSLNEVTVSAGLPDVYIKGDAQVTTVENSILAEVGSADDVLGKIPGINKSQGKLEVFGKGEPLIYINGRQVRDRSELEQLNAKDIQRVELVTNPGARYDATVGAVVRIVTKKDPNEGLGVDLRSSVYQSADNTDLRDIVSLNYRKKGWQLLATVDYRDVKTLTHADFIQENRLEDDWLLQNNMTEDIRNARVSSVFEANYSFGSENIIGVRYSPTFWAMMNDSLHLNSTVEMNGAYYDQWESRQQLRYDYDISHRVNAFYLGKLGNTSIDFNADYLNNGQTIYNNCIEYSSEWDDRIIQSKNPVKNNLLAGKLTFATPLWGGEVTYGSQASFTSRRDDYISLSEFTETSLIRIQDRNLAAFVEYSRTVPFSETVIGSFAIGCRYEHAAYNYYEQDLLVDDQSKRFNNIFPSASVSIKTNEIQLMANYSARTHRPSYYHLRNSVEYANRFLLQTGNPYLEPSITHDIVLLANWRFLSFTADYQHNINVIMGEWMEPSESDPRIIINRPVNYDKMPTLYLSLTASPKIGIWNPRWVVELSKQWFSLENQDNAIDFGKPLFRARWNNMVSFPHGWYLDADFSFSGKGYYSGIYYCNRNVWICDLAVRKSFLEGNLNLTLGVSDLFNQAVNSINVYWPTVSFEKYAKYDSREIYLTVRYRLKAKASKYRGSLAGEEERQRL